MNKIQQLKIKNYKRKIKEQYKFLRVKEVSYGKDDSNYIDDMMFCRMIRNSEKGVLKRIYIFDFEKNAYIPKTDILNFSKELIKTHLHHFNDVEWLVVSILFNGEDFGMRCGASEFISYFDKIDIFDPNITIFSEDHRKFLSITRLEYELEFQLV